MINDAIMTAFTQPPGIKAKVMKCAHGMIVAATGLRDNCLVGATVGATIAPTVAPTIASFIHSITQFYCIECF